MYPLVTLTPNTKIIAATSTELYLQNTETGVGFKQSLKENNVTCFHPIRKKDSVIPSYWLDTDEIVECYGYLVNISHSNPKENGEREKYCSCKVCIAHKKRKKQLARNDEQRVIILNIPYTDYNMKILNIAIEEMGYDNYKPCIRFNFNSNNQIIALIHSLPYYHTSSYSTYSSSQTKSVVNSFYDMKDYEIVTYIKNKLKAGFTFYKTQNKGQQFTSKNQNIVHLYQVDAKISDIYSIYEQLDKVYKSLKLRYDMTHMKKNLD